MRRGLRRSRKLFLGYSPYVGSTLTRRREGRRRSARASLFVLALGLSACKESAPTLDEKSCGTSAARLIACARHALSAASAYELALDYRIQHSFPPGLHGASPDAPSVVVLSRSRTLVQHRPPHELVVRAEVTEEPLYEGIPARTRQLVIANQDQMLGSVAILDEQGATVSEERVVADRKRLASKDRPFDAGLSLPGTGFVPGRELLGTIRYILDRYTPVGAPWVVEKEGRRVIEQAFERDPEKFADELFSQRHELVAQLVVAQGFVTDGSEADRAELEALVRRSASAVRALKSAKLYFSAQTLLPLGFELGSSVEHPSHVTLVERFETQPKLDAGSFVITSSAATDITEGVLSSRRSFEEAFKEKPEAVRAARQMLSEAIQKGPSLRPVTTP